MSSFAELQLANPVLTALNGLGYATPTPIQAQAIPVILAGKDILAGAQTGTGKTAAFALPLLTKLLETPRAQSKRPSALILTPTRELADQVAKSIQDYAVNTEICTLAVYGGVSQKPQTEALISGVDILVATPGRLLDLLNQQALELSAVRWLILDEADRMLDLGFKNELVRLLKQLPNDRQTLFFSATFPKSVKDLAYRMLNKPKEIEVAVANATVDTIEQIVYNMDNNKKRAALAWLIGSGNWQQVLVFVRSKKEADDLATELKKDGIKCDSLHGDKSQGARARALEDFKTGQIRALIATDVAARGIDILELPWVVNYELPFNAEDYVHRIGRTGRAGNTGKAISFVARNEEYLLADIETLISRVLPTQWLEGFEPNFDDKTDNVNHGHNLSKQRQKAKAKARSKATYGIKKPR
ncbi:MAG: DEAD/DEAH box helicase [Oleibacter sp.]|nr:DEAD/DEAH box helicase [Thalassolituus sp.]